MKIDRLSADQALAAQDDWAAVTQPDEAPEPEPAGVYTAERGEADAGNAVRALVALQTAQRALSAALPHGLTYLVEHGEAAALVAVVAAVQDVKRDLGQAEAYAARRVGLAVRDMDLTAAGFLQDGRAYEVLKGKDRKAWRHDEWQADARRQVLSGVGERAVIDAETGEALPLAAIVQPLLEGVQEVHGSTAPRTRALKALGLDPDEYAETVPGPWAVKISRPSE